MNKLELISKLAEQEGISKQESRRVVDLMFDSMTDALTRGDRVEIRGLCALKIKEYKSYTGRNPKSGETVIVKPKRLPFFKPGTDLKDRVDL
ncbi:MAG: integration host factor subunit beta [Desulfobacteraceae bacterium]|nr:integration host factor subunit beta [Desulfobacteraceae bacterium]